MLEIFKALWARQNAFVRRLIRAQNTVLMSVAYVAGLGPVALGFRLLGRAGVERPPPEPGAITYWTPRRGGPTDMKSAVRRW